MNRATADWAAASVNTSLSETLKEPRRLHGMLLQSGFTERVVDRMSNETAKRSDELYIVEVDGVKRSEHRVFVEALKCGMEFKIRHPRSNVKLRDGHDSAPPAEVFARRRTWGIGQANVGEPLAISAHGLRTWVSERANVISFNDQFLENGQPPTVAACDRRYVINPLAANSDFDPRDPCPPEI